MKLLNSLLFLLLPTCLFSQELNEAEIKELIYRGMLAEIYTDYKDRASPELLIAVENELKTFKSSNTLPKPPLQPDYNLPNLPNKYYVSNNIGGDGSEANPYNFFDVMEGRKPIPPNSIVYVKAGHYKRRPNDILNWNMSGLKDKPIIIRPYNNDRVHIDMCVAVNFDSKNTSISNNVFLVGMEIAISEPMHLDGSDSVDRPLGGIWLAGGDNIKLINNYIHSSTSSGLNLWSGATNVEVYGNISTGNGNVRSDRAHGHGIYSQNKAPSVKSYKHNIITSGPTPQETKTFALSMYGSSNAFVENVTIDSNVFIGRVVIGKTDGPSNDIVYTNNIQDRGGFGLGYQSDENIRGVFTNNVMVGGSISFKKWKSLEVGGNTLYANNPNRYIGEEHNQYFNVVKSYQEDVEDRYQLWVNEYDPDLAYLVCMNLDGDNTVDVEMGDFLNVGDSFKLYRYNIFKFPIYVGNFQDSVYRLPMFEPQDDYEGVPTVVNTYVIKRNE